MAAYLARYRGLSRDHTASDLRVFLVWCAERDLDPLAAQRAHLELYVRWCQEVRRFKPSTVSRRTSVVCGFYRTCVIDGRLEHSPAQWLRRPTVPPESPTLGLTHLQFEALLTAARESREVVMYNTPGRAVAIHPSRGNALAFFAFRSPAVPDFDFRDIGQHKRLLAAAFADGLWRVPELLKHVHAAGDLYFDSVSQVRVRPWWRGRVALLGDAASCVSLFGDGSSLAMAGAFTLAEELAASSGDHRLAFRRYEAEHRTLVDPKQRNIARGASLLIPATRQGMLARNLATRLWPVGAAAGWLWRRVGPVS